MGQQAAVLFSISLAVLGGFMAEQLIALRSSEMSLPAISPKLRSLGDKITSLLDGYLGSSLPFETVGVTLAFDSTQSKQLFTPFQILRLAETPFSQKKYYSGAPLKTSDHIQVIKDFEMALAPALPLN